MLSEGLELMVVGMSVVFCFLLLLVAAMHGSALLFGTSGTSRAEQARKESPTDYAEIAVAVAAVMKHRETGKG